MDRGQKQILRVDVLRAILDLEEALAGNDEALAKLAMVNQKFDDLSIVVYAASSAGEAIAVIQDTENGRGVHTLVTNGYMELVGLGNDALEKTSWAQVVHKDDIGKVSDHYKERMEDPSVSSLCEARIISRTRGTVPVEINVGEGDYKGKSAYVVFLRDISRRKELEKRAAQVDKFKYLMEGVKGLAHDMNNAFTCQSALDIYPVGEVPEELLRDISEKTKYLHSLVAKLNEFSGLKFSETIDHTSMRDLVDTVELLVKDKYSGLGVDFQYDIGDDCDVFVQPFEFKRTLLNLLVNAGEAIEEAEMRELEEWDCRKEVRVRSWREKDHVMITVSDTGIGVATDTGKIYLPGYSTKSKGRPSGLGLALASSTVVHNDGEIWHKSEGLGKGTTFTIKLPYRPRPKRS